MATTRIGDLQVTDFAEYGEGKAGFVIEQFAYWNCAEPCWAIPAWDERGAGSLEGPFATREEAELALASVEVE